MLWLSLESAAVAQIPGAALAPNNQAVEFKEPQAHRVYQRERNGRATIPLVLDPEEKDFTLMEAVLQGHNGAMVEGVRFEDDKLTGVPTGGPYHIQCTVKARSQPFVTNVSTGPFFVGDLWVLAGQSNMEGYGDLVDVAPPHPEVMVLGMDGKWDDAEEPLHWLVDSPDPVHSGDPKDRAQRSAEQHKNRHKGGGLGLPFASVLQQRTGVPIGLVPVAHGGTSLEQWSPSKKDEGGKSLYGSMLRQVKLAGNRVTGVLWYQGESDANGGAADQYAKNFTDFIAAVRSDFHQPELPFYYVQLGRFINAGDPKGWNTVQEVQRRLPERVSNTAVISVIDLELDDGIHIGTQGHKRAGNRLAQIALRELFGQVGATTPTFDRVTKGADHTLTVKFRGVNMNAVGPQFRGGMGMGQGGPGPGAHDGRHGHDAPSINDAGIGLRPSRHIGGFSIRDDDG